MGALNCVTKPQQVPRSLWFFLYPMQFMFIFIDSLPFIPQSSGCLPLGVFRRQYPSLIIFVVLELVSYIFFLTQLLVDKTWWVIWEDIYRLYIQVTWNSPSMSLGSNMSFYLEHFLELQDGIIVCPPESIHTNTLDALTQDSLGTTFGRVSSTLSGDWLPSTTFW